MTTPTVPLGDFTTVPVSYGIPQMVWVGQPGTTVTFANQDLNNAITIARRPNFAIGSGSAMPIRPLGSITVDGSKTIWGLAPQGTANLVVMPGGGDWNPSPADVAASISTLGLATLTEQIAQNTSIPTNISTTGVPLLTAQNVLGSSGGGTSIAASGSLTVPSSGTLALNQIGFELVVQAKYTSTAGTNPFVMCAITFIDSVTGLTVDETLYVLTATTSGANWPQRIKGPTKANTCKITFTNLDTAQAITVAYSFMVNSRPYTQDALDWLVSSFLGLPGTIPGHTLPSLILPDTNTLAVFLNSGLAASGQDGWLIPPQIGVQYLNIQETGVAGSNIAVSLQPIPASVYGATTPWLINDLMVAGNPNKLNYTYYGNRAPLQINIKNNGTVNAVYVGMITSGVAD